MHRLQFMLLNQVRTVQAEHCRLEQDEVLGVILLSAAAGVKGGHTCSGVRAVPHSGPGQRVPGCQQGRVVQPAHHRLLLWAPLPGMAANCSPVMQPHVLETSAMLSWQVLPLGLSHCRNLREFFCDMH